jgi:hypothetical protein
MPTKATMDFDQNALVQAIQGSRKTATINTATDSAAPILSAIGIGALC